VQLIFVCSVSNDWKIKDDEDKIFGDANIYEGMKGGGQNNDKALKELWQLI
jgi:hypothetical protein